MVDLMALGGPLYKTNILEEDIDFVASAEETLTISILRELRELVRGRIYIDELPSSDNAFSAWMTLTLYNKAAMKGEDAFYRTSAKLVYTELEAATAIGSPDITPDDQTDFNPNDLALILGVSNEYVRLQTIANTMVAEDNLENVHAINTGLVRVVEFSGFSLFNLESNTNIYARLAFAASQDVSLKMELVVGK